MSGPVAAPSAARPGPIVDDEQPHEVHVTEYLAVIAARRWFLVATFLLVVGGVAAYTYAQTPIYKASALVLIEPKQINVTNVQDLYDPTGGSTREYYTTQHQLLASRRIAEPVHQELALERSISIDDMLLDIVVDPLKNSRLVRVSYRSTDPVLAVKVANALVESYVRDSRQRSLGINAAGLAQLREQAKELRAKVEASARELEVFKGERQYPILDQPEQRFAARLKVLDAQLADARNKLVWTEAELSSAALQPVEPGPELQGVERQLSALQEERARLAVAFKHKHPRLNALDAQLALLREQHQVLTAQAQEAAREVTRARVAAIREVERSILAEIEQVSRATIEASQDATAYKLLTQAYESALQTYQQVIARVSEIDLAAKAGSKDTNIFVIERAQLPDEPDEPNVRRNLLLGVVVGLLGGIACCFLIDYFDRSIKGREDVERRLGATVLGHVPAVDSADRLVVTAHPPPRSVVAEAFRAIRTAVSFGNWNGSAPGPRALLVTSALPGDGKTLVSANLAVALAQLGKRVILIDTDLRNPNVHRVFGLGRQQERGLSTLLAEGVEGLDEALQAVPELPTLSLLPAGPKPPNPADLLNGEAMRELVRRCQERCDWLILDSAPTSVADPVILSTVVPQVLLVVRTYTTPWDLAQRACQALTEIGGRVFGVVLNDVDLPTQVGRYGYGYGYGHRYGEPANGRATEAEVAARELDRA